jgi:hypothetical protein
MLKTPEQTKSPAGHPAGLGNALFLLPCSLLDAQFHRPAGAGAVMVPVAVAHEHDE